MVLLFLFLDAYLLVTHKFVYLSLHMSMPLLQVVFQKHVTQFGKIYSVKYPMQVVSTFNRAKHYLFMVGAVE